MFKNPRISYKSDTTNSESQDDNSDANKNWKVQFDTISRSFDFINSWFEARKAMYLYKVCFCFIFFFLDSLFCNDKKRECAAAGFGMLKKNNRQHSAPFLWAVVWCRLRTWFYGLPCCYYGINLLYNYSLANPKPNINSKTRLNGLTKTWKTTATSCLNKIPRHIVTITSPSTIKSNFGKYNQIRNMTRA